jgi:hypothetical protein
MAKFFTAEVDLNWYLEMFEKYTGEQIRSVERYGYRDQCRIIDLKDRNANERFSVCYSGPNGAYYQFRLNMDTGTLDFCRAPEAGDLCVKALFEKENPGMEVVAVNHSTYSDKWVLSCRK